MASILSMTEETKELKPSALIRSDELNEKVLDMSGNEIPNCESISGWNDVDELGLLNMFQDLNSFKDDTGKVEWDKLDYEIYGEDWYREKYPNFPDEWYELLVNASKEKYKDLQSGIKDGIKIKEGNFTVKFD